MHNTPKKLIVIMGVSGCGKSTIGLALATTLNCPFIEGDDLHSDDARKKMAAGTPLTDEDRWPWLARIGVKLEEDSQRHGNVVATCSALKKSYRKFLTHQVSTPIRFFHLQLNLREAIARLTRRENHFMPADLVQSQFLALEPPGIDEIAVTIDATQTPEAVVRDVMRVLHGDLARNT